jgi:dTDP-4-amino-4,6-dideoxygalactose transaminase
MAAFEAEFSAFTGARQAVAVNSATAGLHLALEACGVGPGDWVLTSPYTFNATAEVVRYLGAEVQFVDIGQRDYLMDPGLLEEALGSGRRIKAIIPVHVAGMVCDMARIRDIACSAGSGETIRIIEDAAHAFPSRLPEGMAGCLGDLGVFSFYVTKTITTGEGGMVVTADEAMAARMRVMRLHGIDRPAWDRYTSRRASWRYAIVEAGYKYNLTDIAAAIGRVQLAKADALLERRRAIAAAYDAAFSERDYLRIPPRGPGHAWQLYSLSLVLPRLRIDRDEYIDLLQEAGIGVSVHFIPLHIMPYWAKRYGLRPDSFPRALERFESVISLPIWPGMDDAMVERVISTVLKIGDSRTVRS